MPDLPPYRQRVSAASRLREVSEVVEWSAEVSPGSIAWVDKPSRTEAVGRCRLDNGADVQVFVEISAPSASRPSFPAGEAGILVFWVPLPESSQLRQRTHALEHVRHQGRLYWYHQPDVRGLVAAAQSRVNSVARDNEERLARDAGRRWKAVHDRLVQSGAQDERSHRAVYWRSVTPRSKRRNTTGPLAGNLIPVLFSTACARVRHG